VGLFQNKYGVWGFNDRYILGIRFFGMPIEEYLFFITIPYACTFIYEGIQYFQKRRVFADSAKHTIRAISFLLLVASFFCLHRAYTFSVLFIGGIFFPIATVVLKADKLDKFIQMYLISLLPMFIVNGLLTALPVVIYDNTQNLGIRIGTIPVEDFLYSAILLLMNITLYEWYISSGERTG
jgi:lycopene cyclase domain-containing protein